MSMFKTRPGVTGWHRGCAKKAHGIASDANKPNMAQRCRNLLPTFTRLSPRPEGLRLLIMGCAFFVVSFVVSFVGYQPAKRSTLNVQFPTLNRMMPALAALLLLACGASLRAATPPRRFGSGPLTRSVQNEADAAIDRALRWLIQQQAPNGAWGGDSPYLTAICALAVSGDGAPPPAPHESALARALAWLKSHPGEDASTDTAIQAGAWRELALRVLADPPLPATPLTTPTNLLATFAVLEVQQMRGEPLPPRTSPEPELAEEAAILAAQRQLPSVTIRERLGIVAQTWQTPASQHWRDEEAQRAWWLARTINRHAHGVLTLGPTQTLDWRRELANPWIGRQRIATNGSGYWHSDNITAIEETAFAILLLREL